MYASRADGSQSAAEWTGRLVGHTAESMAPQLVPESSPRSSSGSAGSTGTASVASPSARLLAELAALGGNVATLARLARQDRAALNAELKALGVSKVGARLQTQAALLSEGLLDVVMPSMESALRKSKDERELEALLKLADFGRVDVEAQLAPLLASLLAAGVSVRMMQQSTLHEVERALLACASTLRAEERLSLLETCHVHVHRRQSMIDNDVRRVLRGNEKETLAAALATAAWEDDDGTSTSGSTAEQPGGASFVAVSRAITG